MIGNLVNHSARRGPIATLIAETGGQNMMIVDSSALLEQVVADILSSSFQSAGQRCSALRVLFVQEDVASRLVEMLAGAMAELKIGDPWSLATDVGPVIDEEALAMLYRHAERMEKEARLIYRCKLPESAAQVSNLIYLTPFLSLIVIHFAVGEPIYPSTLIGLTLIITGILLQQYGIQIGGFLIGLARRPPP